MKRRIPGLNEVSGLSANNNNDVPDGIFLVRVDKAQYRWHAQKPFYTLRLSVLEPRELAGRSISGRLYCTPKALWKLGWFLRRFGSEVNLSNIAAGDVLGVETLRLGLRSDTLGIGQ